MESLAAVELPDQQRNYVWSTELAQTLFEDIWKASDCKTRSVKNRKAHDYLLGAFIFLKEESGSSRNAS